MEHPQNKVRLTTAEKAKMRYQVNIDLGQIEDITAYFINLEQVQHCLGRWGINIDKNMLIAATVKQVYKCIVFTHDHKMQWEDLKEEDQYWKVFKVHFIKSNDEEKQYEEATANKGELQDIS